jgi:hypothetical protein
MFYFTNMRNVAEARNFEAKSHSFHILEIYTSEILLTDRIHHTAVQVGVPEAWVGAF